MRQDRSPVVHLVEQAAGAKAAEATGAEPEATAVAMRVEAAAVGLEATD